MMRLNVKPLVLYACDVIKVKRKCKNQCVFLFFICIFSAIPMFSNLSVFRNNLIRKNGAPQKPQRASVQKIEFPTPRTASGADLTEKLHRKRSKYLM